MTMGAGQKFYAAFDVTNTGGNSTVYFAHFKDAGPRVVMIAISLNKGVAVVG